MIFDTSNESRKDENLKHNDGVALVIGWGDDWRSVQYEGTAYEPTGDDLARYKTFYFAKFPDGREREQWPDIAYFVVRPRWVRYSDWRGGCHEVFESF